MLVEQSIKDPSYSSVSGVMQESPFLTRSDVDRLLEDNSIDSRVEIAGKVSQQYVNAQFNEVEKRYAEQIFRLLMRDGELRVRQELARRLDLSSSVPRDVILSLANDHERVSIPILRGSNVLSDADLIAFAKNSDELGKLGAIAGRNKLSARVSHSLIETNYPQVIKTLLDNTGATIAAQDYGAILKDHASTEAITESLALRPDLPLVVAEKLIYKVSAQVSAMLKHKYEIDVEPLRKKSQESLLAQVISPRTSDDDISETINQMYALGRLSTSMLISALCRGHLSFFEIGMAKLAGIPKANARKLIRDKGVYGFEALYEKVKMPPSLFPPIQLLVQAVIALNANPDVEIGSKLYLGFVIDHMTRSADGKPVENLDYLIQLIRHSIETPMKF